MTVAAFNTEKLECSGKDINAFFGGLQRADYVTSCHKQFVRILILIFIFVSCWIYVGLVVTILTLVFINLAFVDIPLYPTALEGYAFFRLY